MYILVQTNWSCRCLRSLIFERFAELYYFLKMFTIFTLGLHSYAQLYTPVKHLSNTCQRPSSHASSSQTPVSLTHVGLTLFSQTPAYQNSNNLETVFLLIGVYTCQSEAVTIYRGVQVSGRCMPSPSQRRWDFQPKIRKISAVMVKRLNKMQTQWGKIIINRTLTIFEE